MLRFDAEAARRTEAAYTTPELVAQRREVLRLLALQPGESVLDIGSGSGLPGRGDGRGGRAGRARVRRRPEREHARARPQPRRRSRDPQRLRRGAAAARRRGRRRGLHAGVRVRARHAEALAESAACAAPRRPAARAGHRLGLDRLAQQRSRADASGARGLGRAPGRSLPAADARAPPCGPRASTWARPPLPVAQHRRGPRHVQRGSDPPDRRLRRRPPRRRRGDGEGLARGPRRPRGRLPSSASTATCSARACRAEPQPARPTARARCPPSTGRGRLRAARSTSLPGCAPRDSGRSRRPATRRRCAS